MADLDSDDRYADLHLHSTCSDGADSPEVVVERAAATGLNAIALTDHDTVSGLANAAASAEAAGITFLTGVEISTGRRGQEIHVLGYGIDPANEQLLETFERVRIERDERAAAMVHMLNDAGIEIDLENVRRRSTGTLGRMHVAQELLAAGAASSVQNAFDRYLKRGGPGYVAKPLMSVGESINLIHAAGGLAFFAHPGLSRQGKRLTDILDEGFDGIEAIHSAHSPARSQRYLELAGERGLLVSGGSDCHGMAKGRRVEMGRTKLPWIFFEKLQEALSRGEAEPGGSG